MVLTGHKGSKFALFHYVDLYQHLSYELLPGDGGLFLFIYFTSVKPVYAYHQVIQQ